MTCWFAVCSVTLRYFTKTISMKIIAKTSSLLQDPVWYTINKLKIYEQPI